MSIIDIRPSDVRRLWPGDPKLDRLPPDIAARVGVDEQKGLAIVLEGTDQAHRYTRLDGVILAGDRLTLDLQIDHSPEPDWRWKTYSWAPGPGYGTNASISPEKIADYCDYEV